MFGGKGVVLLGDDRYRGDKLHEFVIGGKIDQGEIVRREMGVQGNLGRVEKEGELGVCIEIKKWKVRAGWRVLFFV